AVARIDRCIVEAEVLEGRRRKEAFGKPGEDGVVEFEPILRSMEVLNRIDIPASQGRRKSEDIVAWPAAENISAALSIEAVIADAAADVVRAGVAGDDVVKLLASGIDVGAAGQHDLLDVLADGGVADRRENLLPTAPGAPF